MTEASRQVHVRGVGRESRPPDLAVIAVGVETRGGTAGTALAANNSAAASVLSVLRAHGIEPGDIQTSQINVHPDHDHTTGRAIGYVVSNQLSVKIRSLAAAGSVLDAVAAAAGDSIRVHGLHFELADRRAAERVARAAAVDDARDQAQQLTAAAGVLLGPLLRISTVRVATESFPAPMFAARAAVRETMTIEGGSVDVSVEVDLIFQIGDVGFAIADQPE